MKIIIVAFLILVIIGKCSGFSGTESKDGQNMSYILLEQDKVKMKLKDPDSAQFRNAYISSINVVCGEINGKNSLGGYSGFQRFISGADLQVVESDMQAGEMNIAWSKFCLKK